MKKILIFVWLLLISSISFAIELSPTKLYPPYPDVWGHDVSDFPAVQAGASGMQAYRMPDGDIWFVINYSSKLKESMRGLGGYKDKKYVLIKFFKREQIELDEKQRQELYKMTEGKKISSLDPVVNFKDGSTLTQRSEPTPRLCLTPDFIHTYYLKKDSNNKEVKYTFLGATPHPRIMLDAARCDVEGAPFFYQRLSVLYDLIDVGDDTFIVYAGDTGLMIRFDKDFNTQFKPIHPFVFGSGQYILRNFFVVEYSVIDALKSKIIRQKIPYNQSMQDELILYFKNKYQQ